MIQIKSFDLASLLLSIFILLFLYFSNPVHATTIKTHTDDIKASNKLNLTKICISNQTDDDLIEHCDKGYVLKTEILDDGTFEESVFMDDYDGYGWSHTTIKKIRNNIYLFRLGCGTYCAGNILVGLNGKEQAFDYWFAYDALSQCAVEYNIDKKLWEARPFFSNSVFELQQTFGDIESAAIPKYQLEFVGDSMFVVKSNFTDIVDYIYNPCNR